ncbi:hypothetical protein K504DRAFT_502545 [Pleomassaria siparia CBS 279.74]|uniref:Uncharacterized protein n=1 Tax=Pleomassaria siparia CBS 279.74 TaxID=1314801 RepID=A0A6G1KBU8_9PLEO|nr:hypothetical protein K504DRAFT_502545 [Pleomassaria siparia CBS 279.74]
MRTGSSSFNRVVSTARKHQALDVAIYEIEISYHLSCVFGISACANSEIGCITNDWPTPQAAGRYPDVLLTIWASRHGRISTQNHSAKIVVERPYLRTTSCYRLASSAHDMASLILSELDTLDTSAYGDVRQCHISESYCGKPVTQVTTMSSLAWRRAKQEISLCFRHVYHCLFFPVSIFLCPHTLMKGGFLGPYAVADSVLSVSSSALDDACGGFEHESSPSTSE